MPAALRASSMTPLLFLLTASPALAASLEPGTASA
jgi:hypothetical protein